MAAATADRYLGALVAGRYSDAWQLLAPASQAFWGSPSAYASERDAFLLSAGSAQRVSLPDSSADTLARWQTSVFDGDASRAFVVQVDYPSLEDSDAGFSILIVAPDTSGAWRIWIAH
jgi:hypothetical protein